MRSWMRIAAVFAVILAARAALPAGLQVVPTVLNFSAQDHALGVTLSNSESAPIRAQVRIFHWTQANGTETLATSDVLIASPPMVVLNGGERQLLRIVRPEGPSAAVGEDAFRLLIDELPDPGEIKPGVKLVLRYSIPVFLQSDPNATPELNTHLEWHDGQWHLRITNSGGAHAQLSRARLSGASGFAANLSDGLFGYVLRGASRSWDLPAGTNISPEPLSLQADLNAQPWAQAVSVDTPDR